MSVADTLCQTILAFIQYQYCLAVYIVCGATHLRYTIPSKGSYRTKEITCIELYTSSYIVSNSMSILVCIQSRVRSERGTGVTGTPVRKTQAPAAQNSTCAEPCGERFVRMWTTFIPCLAAAFGLNGPYSPLFIYMLCLKQPYSTSAACVEILPSTLLTKNYLLLAILPPIITHTYKLLPIHLTFPLLPITQLRSYINIVHRNSPSLLPS